MAWTDLSGAFGFGTKLTSTQQQQLRDNIAAAFNGDAGAPTLQTAAIATGAVDTAAIATGAVGQDEVAASAIGQGELKSTTGSVLDAGPGIGYLTLPGGEYGFYPQIRMSSTASTAYLANMVANDDPAGTITSQSGFTSYTTAIQIGSNTGNTIYAQQRYIQASPPYKIGDITWGHFVFLLKEIATGKIKSMYEAEDPPWAYNGSVWNAKDSIKRIQEIPHPFINYFNEDPSISGFEIILIDMSEINMTILMDEMRIEETKEKIEFFKDKLKLDKKNPKVLVDIPTIDGFTNKIKFEKPGV
jgi:hypothetical protein